LSKFQEHSKLSSYRHVIKWCCLLILKAEKKEELPIRLTKKIDGLITSSFALCNRFSAYSSCDSGACSRSSYSSGGDGCDDDGCSGDGCDDGGGCNSGGKSEQTHYSQQVDLLQKALLLLP
jgi:hypothetical protein